MEKEKRTHIGGGYWLVRDSFCCWIMQERTSKNGKKYAARVSGFTANVEDALESAVNLNLRGIDAESIKVLIDEIKSLKSIVRALSGVIKQQEDNE